jgi:branched-chain amino acid transport system ATP-binding protein
MSDVILRVHELSKSFGGLLATDSFSWELETGELHAIIGPNGAGKTTLVNQLVGEIRPDGGRVEFAGTEITHMPAFRRALLGLSRSYQVTSVFYDFSVLENVGIAAQAHAGHSFGMWRPAREEARLVLPALEVLAQVGLSEKRDLLAATLAHGERRQLEIAMALVSKPRLLLLDEPMAGMSRAESDKIIELIRGLKRKLSIVLVEHDMDAVFALADRITVLAGGRKIAVGLPDEIRKNREVQRVYLGDRYALH